MARPRVMVNDNVQYHVCEEIGVLPRGKGNASQQMGRFGRRELRKSVYRWRRRD